VPNYIPRHIDELIDDYLTFAPAFAIDGIKAVGKTSSAKRRAKTVLELDRKPVQEIVVAQPDVYLASTTPVLIDEWQRLPDLWDYVRRAVDEDSRPGRFILTGSAGPGDASIHSGSGRIVRLRMRPLSIAERLRTPPLIKVDDLLAGNCTEVSGGTDADLRLYLEEIFKSGFPGIRAMNTRGQRVYLDSYLENLVNKEFAEQGHRVRKPKVLLGWLRAYAAATGSTASYQSIMDASTPGEPNKPSKSTTQIYRDILDGLWVTDRVEPWIPMETFFKYVGKSPKHYLADPSLAARLLGLTIEGFKYGDERKMLGQQAKSTAGRLFEALVGLSLQSYAQLADAELLHFRTPQGDHEVDFIIARGDQVLAIEVKLGESPDSNQVDNLNWFERTFCSYKVTKVLISTGANAYTRKDGTHVIPASLIG
jgi:predicted AAA+ superfamily ATPase